MNRSFIKVMEDRGYTFVGDLFSEWEQVKDEILPKEMKVGTGSGTIHIFLGDRNAPLFRNEFPAYTKEVEDFKNTDDNAPTIKHFFVKSNLVSMAGYYCRYLWKKGNANYAGLIAELFCLLDSYGDDELIETTSLFKWSLGTDVLRPYFKKFDNEGVFYKVVRNLLLNDSAYKIGLFRGQDGDLATMWLIGFPSFEGEKFLGHSLKNSYQDNCAVQKIFFGAPGTGKSHCVNEKIAFLRYDEKKRQELFEDNDLYCKKNYSSYLRTSIPKIIHKNIYALDTLEDLRDAYNKIKLSGNPNADDYASGLNGYIKFALVFLADDVFRVTFHPDYDYAQFVGSYKPKSITKRDVNGNNVDCVTYSFVPQIFTDAYVCAWKHFINNNDGAKQVHLVIEEINRGNCAQIFGDLFQLLDRNGRGMSRYAIDCDSDFSNYIKQELEKENDVWEKYKSMIGDRKLKFPPNFNILATMNTSDQSLFPMDSAFKRRFDWKYVPIDYNQPKADFIVDLGDGKTFSWLKFLKLVNDDIYEVTKSEDKQMGEFFIKPLDGVIKLEDFCSKVLFYLWDSVYKDETSYDKVFHFKHPKFDNKTVTFQSLFVEEQKYAVDIISQMIDNLEKEASSDEKIKDNGNFVDLLASRNSVAEDVVEEESSDEAVETVVEEDLPEQE